MCQVCKTKGLNLNVTHDLAPTWGHLRRSHFTNNSFTSVHGYSVLIGSCDDDDNDDDAAVTPGNTCGPVEVWTTAGSITSTSHDSGFNPAVVLVFCTWCSSSSSKMNCIWRCLQHNWSSSGRQEGQRTTGSGINLINIQYLWLIINSIMNAR